MTPRPSPQHDGRGARRGHPARENRGPESNLRGVIMELIVAQIGASVQYASDEENGSEL
jgi:hypothetical protein